MMSVEVLREPISPPTHMPRRIPNLEPLHLDHLSPQVGQQHRRRRPLLKLSKVEHANALKQRSRHGWFPSILETNIGQPPRFLVAALHRFGDASELDFLNPEAKGGFKWDGSLELVGEDDNASGACARDCGHARSLSREDWMGDSTGRRRDGRAVGTGRGAYLRRVARKKHCRNCLLAVGRRNLVSAHSKPRCQRMRRYAALGLG